MNGRMQLRKTEFDCGSVNMLVNNAGIDIMKPMTSDTVQNYVEQIPMKRIERAEEVSKMIDFPTLGDFGSLFKANNRI